MPDPTDQTLDTVRAILRRKNITEPGGEWSVWDIARQLDPDAYKPRSMFDTGGRGPSSEYVRLADRAVVALDPPARYVGGVSGHLYHLGA